MQRLDDPNGLRVRPRRNHAARAAGSCPARRRGCVYAIAERADLVQLPDEQVLALAAEEDRVVVTFDIADFAALAGQWADQRRPHHGILFVSTASFRQDRGLLGALVTALDAVARGDRLPGPANFLARQER